MQHIQMVQNSFESWTICTIIALILRLLYYDNNGWNRSMQSFIHHSMYAMQWRYYWLVLLIFKLSFFFLNS